MKQRMLKSLCAFILLLSMLVSSTGLSNVAMAASKKKTPKLSTKSVTLTVGQSKKVTVKNKPAKAKLKWSSKNKKIAKVSKAGKVTAVKKGNTKVICKVTYKNGKKKVTKKLSLTVKVKAKKTTTDPGTNPTVDQTATPTTNPTVNPTTNPGVNPTTEPTVNPTTDPATEPTVNPTTEPTATPDSTPEPDESNLTEEHESANGILTKDNGLMRKDLSNLELMEKMGLGWNLGNQLEQSNWQGEMTTVKQCEQSAGNSASQKTFDGLKAYGVNTVRIPVAWSNFISDDGNYTISEDLFNRVEEVMNYALSNEMYVIINIHWDGGWWGMFGAEEYNEDFDAAETPIRAEAWKKYRAIWTQIAERYKEYSDRLIFAGANEELSGRLNDDYQHPETAQFAQTGKLNTDQIYAVANKINQEFVNIVRASGGNNAYRHLLIPGTGNESCVIAGSPGEKYQQDGTVDERYKMPEDPAEEETGVKKQAVEVHYYDPTDYGISASSTTSWGYRNEWGTEEDYANMSASLEKMKKFTDQGYGVILGECGVVKANKDNIIDWMTELFTQARTRSMVPVWWDEGHYFDRKKGYFTYKDIGDVYLEMTGTTPPEVPASFKQEMTGVQRVPKESNKTPKVIAAWEGAFVRHAYDPILMDKWAAVYGDDYDSVNCGVGITASLTDAEGNITSGEDAKLQYEDLFSAWGAKYGWANSITGANGEAVDKMVAEIDPEFWNIHLKVDWSQIEKPCIRVYPAEDEYSQHSDLQIGYLETKENGGAAGKIYSDKDYDPYADKESEEPDKELLWVGEYVTLDKEMLQEYPWLWITTNAGGACYQKIEICDAAYNADGTPYEEAQE